MKQKTYVKQVTTTHSTETMDASEPPWPSSVLIMSWGIRRDYTRDDRKFSTATALRSDSPSFDGWISKA